MDMALWKKELEKENLEPIEDAFDVSDVALSLLYKKIFLHEDDGITDDSIYKSMVCETNRMLKNHGFALTSKVCGIILGGWFHDYRTGTTTLSQFRMTALALAEGAEISVCDLAKSFEDQVIIEDCQSYPEIWPMNQELLKNLNETLRAIDQPPIDPNDNRYLTAIIAAIRGEPRLMREK